MLIGVCIVIYSCSARRFSFEFNSKTTDFKRNQWGRIQFGVQYLKVFPGPQTPHKRDAIGICVVFQPCPLSWNIFYATDLSNNNKNKFAFKQELINPHICTVMVHSVSTRPTEANFFFKLIHNKSQLFAQLISAENIPPHKLKLAHTYILSRMKYTSLWHNHRRTSRGGGLDSKDLNPIIFQFFGQYI